MPNGPICSVSLKKWSFVTVDQTLIEYQPEINVIDCMNRSVVDIRHKKIRLGSCYLTVTIINKTMHNITDFSINGLST